MLFPRLSGTSLWDKEAKQEPKTWNMDIFIKVVHELQPTLHWKEITYELDHHGFIVKDRQALIFLMKALKLGFQLQGSLHVYVKITLTLTIQRLFY